MDINSFESRHIGANEDDIKKMLNTIGLASIDELISSNNSKFYFEK